MSLSAIGTITAPQPTVATPVHANVAPTQVAKTTPAQNAIPSDKVSISPAAQKLSTETDGDSDGH